MPTLRPDCSKYFANTLLSSVADISTSFSRGAAGPLLLLAAARVFCDASILRHMSSSKSESQLLS